MAQLPPPERWTWHTSGGIRATTLVEDPAGFRLRLMQVLPDLRIPMHTHLGTESILVLDGELEDGEALLTDGQWIFHDRGSCHAPQILEAGCWCLVREEGAVEFHSPMARLRAWLSRAA
jgi:predicted ChrR family anti-sigma factor